MFPFSAWSCVRWSSPVRWAHHLDSFGVRVQCQVLHLIPKLRGGAEMKTQNHQFMFATGLKQLVLQRHGPKFFFPFAFPPVCKDGLAWCLFRLKVSSALQAEDALLEVVRRCDKLRTWDTWGIIAGSKHGSFNMPSSSHHDRKLDLYEMHAVVTDRLCLALMHSTLEKRPKISKDGANRP